MSQTAQTTQTGGQIASANIIKTLTNNDNNVIGRIVDYISILYIRMKSNKNEQYKEKGLLQNDG